MARTITVAVDAMGGDHGPPVTVPAAIGCLRKYPELHLILVGQSQPIQEVILASGLASSHSDRRTNAEGQCAQQQNSEGLNRQKLVRL